MRKTLTPAEGTLGSAPSPGNRLASKRGQFSGAGHTIPVKNFDDRFGLLHIESGSRRSLVIADRETGAIEAYRQIDDLLAASWALGGSVRPNSVEAGVGGA